MENTLENKAKFLSSYLQHDLLVFRKHIIHEYGVIKGFQENGGNLYIQYRPGGHGLLSLAEIKYCSVRLNPISKILDEDAIKVAEIMDMSEDKLFIGKVLCISSFDNSDAMAETSLYNMHCEAIDYIRSKGYAVPFMGLSVEQLIEYGWVKLKQY